MFEDSDFSGGLIHAVMREVEEETGIVSGNFDPTSLKVIAIQKEINGLAVDLIVEGRLLSEVPLRPNEEWDSLTWIDRDKLVLDSDVLSHLKYARTG